MTTKITTTKKTLPVTENLHGITIYTSEMPGCTAVNVYARPARVCITRIDDEITVAEMNVWNCTGVTKTQEYFSDINATRVTLVLLSKDGSKSYVKYWLEGEVKE